jgi:hypothetical protein
MSVKVPFGSPLARVVEPPRRERHTQVIEVPGGQVVSVRLVTGDTAAQEKHGAEVYAVIKALTQPFVLVVDFRDLDSYPAAHREIYASLRERLRSIYGRLHVLTIYVADAPNQRGFVTAIGWRAQASAASGKVFVDNWPEAISMAAEAIATHRP